MRWIFTPTIFALVISYGILIGAFYFDYKAEMLARPKLGTVNLSLAVELREKSLMNRQLTSNEITSAAELFAGRLKKALRELQEECGCTLLVKSAVVSPSEIPDYTETLLYKLGLEQNPAPLKPLFRENEL